MSKYFYMLCTEDKYELPIATFDSVEEMARFLGRPKASVVCSVCRHYRIRYNGELYKLVKVPLKKG